MKTLKISSLFAIALIATISISCEQENIQADQTPINIVDEPGASPVDRSAYGWNIWWVDHFNQSSLDKNRWRIGYPWGSLTHNHEGYAKEQNLQFTGSTLKIIAGGGKEGSKYNTGVISAKTQLDFSNPNVEYVVEARMKLATREGIWPAFWLNSTGGWPNINEIDIMEQKGYGNQHAYETNMHFGVSSGKRPSQHVPRTGPNHLDYNWHRYAVAIKKDEVKIMLDDVTINRVTGSRKNKLRTKTFNIILNSAIGGDWGGQGFKNWINDFSKTSTFEIDYVVVYRRGV